MQGSKSLRSASVNSERSERSFAKYPEGCGQNIYDLKRKQTRVKLGKILFAETTCTNNSLYLK